MVHDKAHSLALGPGDLFPHCGCPVCGSGRIAPFSRGQYGAIELRHHICRDCGLIFMNPLPTQAWYDRLYREEFWEVKAREAASPTEHPAYWHKALMRAEKLGDILAAHVPPLRLGTILEVGAAYGVIGKALADRFQARAFAVEPNETARTFAAEACGATLVGRGMADIAAWRPERRLDLVVFSHVLENVVDLAGAMDTVKRLLRPGGYLLIETPNVDVQTAMSIYHPYCFTRTALAQLLGRHGFRVLAAKTGGRPASVLANRYLTVLAFHSGQAVPLPKARRLARLRARLGHAWYRLTQSGPLGLLDGVLARLRFRLSVPSAALLTHLVAHTKARTDSTPATRRAANAR